jgi:transposase, IS30 family
LRFAVCALHPHSPNDSLTQHPQVQEVYDKGKEFCAHEKIDQALRSTGYFAQPFASWQRCSNENFNGLLRQYIPKKRHMENMRDEEIRMIQNRLNNRPRKRLGFRTPAQVF